MPITIKKQRFARALSAILVATSDDLDRPHLSQVQVWRHRDRLCMSGTDGHWCAIYEDVVEDEAETHRIGISLLDAKFLAGVIALDKPSDTEAAEAEEIEIQIGPGIAIECDKWTVRLQDTNLESQAPDIDSIIKGTVRGSLPCITISPSILADVRKAFKVCGALAKETESLEFSFGPTMLDPVLVTSSAVQDLACVVMPRRPEDVDVQETDGEIRYVRRSTGEVLATKPQDKQTCIAGTEPDPVKAGGEALQAAVDALGSDVKISVNGEQIAEIKPRKRAKKAAAEVVS